MKKNVAAIWLVFSLLFTLFACQESQDDAQVIVPEKPAVKKDKPALVVNEVQKSHDVDLESQINKAKADLSARLGIELDEIKLIQASNVTWPNGSLGCPQKDMSYTQALVPGVLIVLSGGSSKYQYHSGRGGDPRYCARPGLPVSARTAE